jgi:hypothetical protein
MLQSFLVYGSAWLAAGCWFAGLWARRGSGPVESRSYARLWTIGAIVLLLHVAASYLLVHDGSHAAAVAATADQSWRVTGIRAGWGIYLNWLCAVLWLGASIRSLGRGGRPWPGEAWVIGFTGFMMFNATVVFASGTPRWLAAACFLLLCAPGATRLAGGDKKSPQQPRQTPPL